MDDPVETTGRGAARWSVAPSTLPAVLTTGQQARRQRVIDAAVRLTGQREFSRIQMKDVAQEAGVALGTVYHYFSSKEHLFAEVLVTWAAALETNVTRHPLVGATPAERLSETLYRSVQAFQRQPHLAKLVATLQLSTDPFAAEILDRLGRTTGVVYVSALEGVDPAKVGPVVRVVESVLDTVLRSWSAGRLSIVDLYALLDEAVDLVLPPDR